MTNEKYSLANALGYCYYVWKFLFLLAHSKYKGQWGVENHKETCVKGGVCTTMLHIFLWESRER